MAQTNVQTFSGDVGVGTNAPTGQLEVNGAGETATTTFNQAGALGGTLVFRDSGTSSGNGGAIMFGAGQGFFSAIKGNILDGTTNTIGSLGFYTRQATGSGTMTRQMTLNTNGVITSTGGIDKVVLAENATNSNRRVVFSPGATGAQPLYTDAGLLYNPSTNILTTTATSAQAANRAGYATNAGGAQTAQTANRATYATDAGHATNAGAAQTASSATNAGAATNSTNSTKLYTGSIDNTNTNYYVPFRSGHGDGNASFYTDQNLYYNSMNNYINANAAYATNAGHATNAGAAQTAAYATNAGGAQRPDW